jgi:hypothetical protein
MLALLEFLAGAFPADRWVVAQGKLTVVGLVPNLARFLNCRSRPAFLRRAIHRALRIRIRRIGLGRGSRTRRSLVRKQRKGILLLETLCTMLQTQPVPSLL